MLNAVLFDLDGSLLPMNQEEFTKAYAMRLAKKLAENGYDPNLVAKSLWRGVGAMVENTGEETNEAVFWKVFTDALGPEVREKTALFDDFYHNEFQEIAAVTSPSAKVRALVDLLKAKGIHLILATNPFFPKVATDSRIRWAGLAPEDFSHITYYENSHFCKPNPRYYEEITEACGLSPEECLMVGNDVEEDMMAKSLGFSVFLLTDCLLNPKEKDISLYPRGDFDALLAYIEAHI